jgi:hypothetical protein
MHRSKPTKPHQLRYATGVIAIRLHRHRLECVTHMPRLQQLHRKTRLLHCRIEPLRQRTGFQPDPLDRKTKPCKPADQSPRLARNLAFPSDLAVTVNNANARAFQ